MSTNWTPEDAARFRYYCDIFAEYYPTMPLEIIKRRAAEAVEKIRQINDQRAKETVRPKI